MLKFGEKDEVQLNKELKNNPEYPFVRTVTDNGVGDAFGPVARFIHNDE